MFWQAGWLIEMRIVCWCGQFCSIRKWYSIQRRTLRKQENISVTQHQHSIYSERAGITKVTFFVCLLFLVSFGIKRTTGWPRLQTQPSCEKLSVCQKVTVLWDATWEMITCSFSRRVKSTGPKLICLLPSAPKVTPANVSGGGGSRSELVITWEVSKLAQDPLIHGGGSQTSLFSADLGACFINNSRMA